MLKLINLSREEFPSYKGWLERGLDLAYDIIPEQENMPYNEALDATIDVAEGCECIVVHCTETNRFVLCFYEYGCRSQHLPGYGIVMYLTIGNGTGRMYRKLLNYLHAFCRSTTPAHKWIQVHHRVGEYTYKMKYHHVRNLNEWCKESF